jgi:hypothetical protein
MSADAWALMGKAHAENDQDAEYAPLPTVRILQATPLASLTLCMATVL